MLSCDSNLYHPNNVFFFGVDAFILFSFINEFKPKRIIEIGSGYSTALQIDSYRHSKISPPSITCIDPYPDRLMKLVDSSSNQHKLTILKNKIQDVDSKLFSSLEEGDLLFVDSSHVVKSGSDVNWIHFEILPILKPGVLIHFHDIFWPFTYPIEWLRRGIFWSETYLVRSLLMSSSYEVILFNSLLNQVYPEAFNGLPSTPGNFQATSLYIQKI